MMMARINGLSRVCTRLLIMAVALTVALWCLRQLFAPSWERERRISSTDGTADKAAICAVDVVAMIMVVIIAKSI